VLSAFDDHQRTEMAARPAKTARINLRQRVLSDVVTTFSTVFKGALTRARPPAAAGLTREPSRRPTSG
jgi:hypothetical protein